MNTNITSTYIVLEICTVIELTRLFFFILYSSQEFKKQSVKGTTFKHFS